MTLNTEVATYTPRDFTELNFVRMLSGSCGNSSTATGNRASIVVGRLTYAIDNPSVTNDFDIIVSGMKIANSVQAICVPRYGIGTADIVQNGTSVQDVSFTQESSSQDLGNVKAWDFMQAQINIITTSTSVGKNWFQSSEINLGGGSAINFDGYTNLTRSAELRQVPDSALTDATLWLDAIPRYFQRFSAQLAKNSILEPVSVIVKGNQTRDENRLMIVGPTCHIMATLVGFCALLSIVIIITLPKNCLMNTNPTSILGTAWTATEATSLLLRLRDQGLGKSQAIQQRLGTAAYALSQPRPNIFKLLPDHSSSRIRSLSSSRSTKSRRGGKYALTLHPASRALFLLTLSGGIVTLEVLLRLSQKNNGIGPSNLSQYLQYSWTVVPSIFFTAMASVAGSIDVATRSLVPFLALKKGGSLVEMIDFELLDGSRPRMLTKGLKARSWPAVFAIAAFSVSSTFTIFSGSLYRNQYRPINLSTTLRANTSFNWAAPSSTSPVPYFYSDGSYVLVSSLILGHNGSFQPFTYKDLAFPSLVLEESALIYTNEDGTSGSNGVTVVANLPAVRSRLQCKLYSGEQIRTNLTLNYTATGDTTYSSSKTYRVPNPLRMDIDDENCLAWDSVEYMASTIMIPTLKEGMGDGEVTFGVSSGEKYGEANSGEGWVGGCGTILYAWGRVAVDANGKSKVDAYALGCNETVEVVDAEVHFNSTALSAAHRQNNILIDWQITWPNKPPVPDEDSARLADSQPDFARGSYYNRIVGPAITDSARVYDNFFALLTSSPWAVPDPDLANAAAVDKVVAAIRAQHGLVRATYIDSFFRGPVDESSPDVTSFGALVSPNTLLYSANATIIPGRSRVMQDLQSTRLLQTLLAVTLALSLIAWCFMLRTDVIVGSPTNIARKLALAAGGNLFGEVLPCGSENLETEKIRHREDCKFIIGWRSPDATRGKEERFGIWALTAEEVEKIRARQAKGSRWKLWKRR
ncbi:hypothetical protein F4801DRAFT_581619 [Xylaria longipes]|nr:hypothetical protein F4801DRAFT_581619 [Xylaria longipes]